MLASRPRRRAALGALLLLGPSATIPRSEQALAVPEDAAGRSGPSIGASYRTSAAVDRRAASARQPYRGFWAADHAGCADPDSDGRMAIQADTIQWYETRCRVQTIASAGRAVWHLGLKCRGEGQRIEVRATVKLPTVDTLVVENGPIGPSRRQRYIRCLPR